ncbi:MAG: ArsI/CadI family heavy metal resistance metalloenzyme [Pseudomonadota bacterium]
MKRLHIHIHTDDLDESVRYYEALFGAAPTRREADYAKWLLDDPRAHIALSTGGKAGIEHVGVAVEDDDALEQIARRIAVADAPVQPEKQTTCCYAQSNKYWSHDPQGTVWELFHTYGDSAEYGAKPQIPAATDHSCCSPTA